MRTSQRGIAFIASHEGLRLTAYKPVAAERYYTIGYGHYGSDVKRGMRITKSRALELLRRDVRSAENAVNKYVKVGLNQNRFDALVSFCFNVGVGNFKDSTLVRLLNKKQYSQVDNQLMRWVRGEGGRVLAGLQKRRRDEARLFNKPRR
jgi:lysozyme